MNDLLFDAVNGLAGKSSLLDAVMLFAAGPLIYLLFLAGGGVLLWNMRGRGRTDNIWMVGQVGAALAIGFLVNRVLRMMGLANRPFESREVHQLVEHEPGVSFPSNHSTAAITVAVVIWLFVSARVGAVLTAVAALVALSRVFVGVHWPGDVLGGALVGVLSSLLVWWAARRLRERFAAPVEVAPALATAGPATAGPATAGSATTVQATPVAPVSATPAPAGRQAAARRSTEQEPTARFTPFGGSAPADQQTVRFSPRDQDQTVQLSPEQTAQLRQPHAPGHRPAPRDPRGPVAPQGPVAPHGVAGPRAVRPVPPRTGGPEQGRR
ncbi:undecaprenyl-diphosphatase [Goodfellowiella coeruleoviolacea]|uniref:Membrane-associated phospholipid phosphatase n=1 Tax=Goodfellowiella coeruleoviolacea TaxID=334858 RepID=A0AAE3KK73_9PSEU|nr:phosphatase PAP2 family protein [Goodfellowiella coeruleoviolacea]MCP2169867.1 Membrane-associated phospholipid phosphatase [Goodfellowiella coeruleoviolacea]